MASGFFPLHEHEPGYAELRAMVARLNEIRAEWQDAIATSNTPEDAATDGGYLERLQIASEFIGFCLRD